MTASLVYREQPEQLEQLVPLVAAVHRVLLERQALLELLEHPAVGEDLLRLHPVVVGVAAVVVVLWMSIL